MTREEVDWMKVALDRHWRGAVLKTDVSLQVP